MTRMLPFLEACERNKGPILEVVAATLKSAARLLASATRLIYWPFRYAGEFATASNAAFDRILRARDPRCDIRDIGAVDALAFGQGFMLREDHALPANNQMIVWRRER